MSSFSDELRNLIAKKAEQLDVAEHFRLRQIEEGMRKEHELEAAAAAVVREVFRPLMTELYEALVAAGILLGSSETVLAQQAVDAHICTLSARSPRATYCIRLYAGVNPEGRIALAAQAEVRDQRSPIAAIGQVREQKPEVSAAWQTFFNSADTSDDAEDAGAPGGKIRPLVEIAGKSIAPDPASMAAEQWCRDALKKIAAACVEAERSKT